MRAEPCVMNIIAQMAHLFSGKVHIIAFAVMNNHLHFVLSGDVHWVNEIISLILKRIKRAFGLSQYDVDQLFKEH